MAAESVIEVVIRARNELRDTLAEIKRQLDSVNAALGGPQNKQAQEAFAKLGQQGTETAGDIKGLADTAEEISSKFHALVRVTRLVIAGWAGLKALQIGKHLAAEAGRVEVLNNVVGIIGTNAGISTKQIKEMTAAIRDQGITSEAAAESLSLLIQSGLVTAETAYRAAKLARAAQDLAVVSGRDSSETFRRMVIAIQQMNTMSLRLLGLMIDREKGEEKYAQKLGKTASQLTLIEKKQAFLGATMAEAAKFAGSYEAAMTNVAKQTASLERYHKELAKTVGNFLLPANLALVEVYTQFLKDVTKSSGEIDELSDASVQLGAIVRGIAQVVADIALKIWEWRNAVLALFAAFLVKKLADSLLAIGRILLELGAGTAAAEVSVTNLHRAWDRVTVSANQAANAQARAVLAARGAGPAAGSLGGAGTPQQPVPQQGAPQQLDLFAANASANAVGSVVGTAAVTHWSKITGFIKGLGPLIQRVAFFTTKWLGILGLAFTAATIIYAGWKAFTSWWENRKEAKRQEDPAYRQKMKDDYLALAKRLEELKVAEAEVTAEQELNSLALKGTKDEAIAAAAETEKLTRKAAALAKESKEVSLQMGGIVSKAVDTSFRAELEDAGKDVKLARATAAKIAEGFEEGWKEQSKLLGLDKIVLKPGLEISKEFYDKAMALSGLVQKAMNPPIDPGTGQKIAVDLREIAYAARTFGEQAKTVDDITIALDVLGEAAELTGENFATLQSELKLKLDKAAVDGLATSFAGFSERIKQATEAFQLQLAIVQDAETSQRALAEVLADTGNSIEELRSGFDDLGRSAGSYVDAAKIIAGLKIEGLKDSARTITTTYEADLTGMEAAFARRREIINNTVAAEGAAQRELVTLDAEYQRRRATLEEEFRTAQTKERLDHIRLVTATETKVYTQRRMELNAIIAAAEVDDVKKAALQTAAAERDEVAQRIARAKTYYAELKRLQSEALALVKTAAAEIRRLEEERYNLSIAKEQTIRDLRRGLMSEQEAEEDKAHELREKRAAAIRARDEGDFKLAKQLGEQEVALARELAQIAVSRGDEGEAEAAIRRTEQALDGLMQTNDEATRSARETAKSAVGQFDALTVSLDEMGQKLQAFSQQQIEGLQVSVDDASLQSAVEKIKNAFSNLIVKVQVTPDSGGAPRIARGGLVTFSEGGLVKFAKFASGGLATAAAAVFNAPLRALRATSTLITPVMDKPIQRASGGHITGPGTGTSDSILAMVSNGEYVLRADAVKHYGVSFIHALNEMKPNHSELPKYATGGPVALKSNFGGEGTARRDVVDVNLTIGSKKVSLMGERDQVRGLVSALKGLEVTR